VELCPLQEQNGLAIADLAAVDEVDRVVETEFDDLDVFVLVRHAAAAPGTRCEGASAGRRRMSTNAINAAIAGTASQGPRQP